jgi:hypothetical protein
MLVDLLIVALAASFVVSFLERWFESGLLRGIASLVMSVGGILVFGYTAWAEVAYLSLAAAFGALLLLLLGERMATPPPMVLDPRHR